MSAESRIMMFENWINDIQQILNNNKASDDNKGSNFLDLLANTLSDDTENKGLVSLLVYDYNDLNDYAKIIVEKSGCLIGDEKGTWGAKYPTKSCFEDKNTRLDAARDFVRYGQMEHNRKQKYLFIFWALMILTVDDRKKEEHLLTICDYAVMLNITDTEIKDIVNVIKSIYQKRISIPIESVAVELYFEPVVKKYAVNYIEFKSKEISKAAFKSMQELIDDLRW